MRLAVSRLGSRGDGRDRPCEAVDLLLVERDAHGLRRLGDAEHEVGDGAYEATRLQDADARQVPCVWGWVGWVGCV